jgi:UDP-glucose:(heptosyl)LPS alpha-1,3-glucosyltransferase
MDIALCYEHVQPARGGCETYIASLARRLAADGHQVHLYATSWDAAALPPQMHYHRLPSVRGPRFLRPWRFGASCVRALRGAGHHVSIGFNKTWGQDVLYPQAGIHAASAEHNLLKFRMPLMRRLARLAKGLDLAHWSFSRLEQHQYLGAHRPMVVVLSQMVAGHFKQFYNIDPAQVRVIPCAVDPQRFTDCDRARGRLHRSQWGIAEDETVALFIAMNYRLKGLEPLLHAVRCLQADTPFRLLVVGNPNTARYERLARRLGIERRVCFAGPCRDIQLCYAAADYLVHPSFYDPFSLVVLEAMSCGLPVITTRYTGASEMMRPPREGYVIEDPHNHSQLAWCMTQLLDPGRRAACGEAARKTANLWTFEHHYRQLLQVFEEAAARKRAA